MEEICKSKTNSKNVCTLLYTYLLRSARNGVRQNIGLCQAMCGHFSKKPCYWSNTLTMVLNAKTMTQNFAKNLTKICKKHHLVCRLRNLHYSLKSWTRKNFPISSCIKVQFLIQKIKNQTLPVLDNK